MSKASTNKTNLGVVASTATIGHVLTKNPAAAIGWAAGGGGGGGGAELLLTDWRSVVEDFGAVGDGVADDTNAFKNALAAAALNGYTIYIPAGTYNLTDTLRIDAAAKPFALVGQHRDLVTLKRAGAYALSVLDFRICNGVYLRDFTVDGGRAAFGAAGQGVGLNQCNNGTVERLRVVNYTNTAVTFSTDGVPANVYYNNHIRDCIADGGGLAANGFNLAQTTFGSLTGCIVQNLLTTGLGTMFNLGGGSAYCTLGDCSGEGGAVGLSMGFGGSFSGPAHCVAQNVALRDAQRLIRIRATTHCSVLNISGDMKERAGGVFLDCDSNSDFNTFTNLAARGLAVDGKLVTFTAATGNSIHFGSFRDEFSTTLPWIEFGSGSNNNSLRIDAVSPEGTPTTTHEILGGAAALSNLVALTSRVQTSAKTLAAGAITIERGVEVCTLDTEAAAASDDLDTITATGARDGQMLVLRTTAAGRDVVVKNNTGNILLGADFLLSTNTDAVTLMWSAATSRWLGISTSNNA